jgi:hypothetical protein
VIKISPKQKYEESYGNFPGMPAADASAGAGRRPQMQAQAARAENPEILSLVLLLNDPVHVRGGSFIRIPRTLLKK